MVVVFFHGRALIRFMPSCGTSNCRTSTQRHRFYIRRTLLTRYSEGIVEVLPSSISVHTEKLSRKDTVSVSGTDYILFTWKFMPWLKTSVTLAPGHNTSVDVHTHWLGHIAVVNSELLSNVVPNTAFAAKNAANSLAAVLTIEFVCNVRKRRLKKIIIRKKSVGLNFFFDYRHLRQTRCLVSLLDIYFLIHTSARIDIFK